MLRGMLTALLFPALFAANPGSNSAPSLGWVKQIDGPGMSQVTGVASDVEGDLFVTGSTSSPEFPATGTYGPASGVTAFVLKLNPSGQVVYSIRFGGAGSVMPAGIAAAADGSVFVAGTATAAGLPVTPGAFQVSPPSPSSITGATSGGSFLFRLNPGGNLAWATYFGDANTFITSVAVGPDGSPFVAGFSYGNLPAPKDTAQPQSPGTGFCGPGIIGVCPGPPTNGFLTKFSADGASLLFSTYATPMGGKVDAMVIDSLGKAYLSDSNLGNLYVMNPSGTTVLNSTKSPSYFVHALALDPEGNLYLTGVAGSNFKATSGAFRTAPQPAIPQLSGYFGPGSSLGEAFVAKLDGGLSHVLAATFLGGEGDDIGQSLAIDRSGNVIVSGQTRSKAFPTLSPFQGPFAGQTGFVAELDGSLSRLIFSTYAGDTRPFGVAGAVAMPDGSIALAGSTAVAVPHTIPPVYNPGTAIIANRINLSPAPPVELDSVVNMASKYAVALSSGEAIEARGSGFGPDAQIRIDGVPLPAVSRTGTHVVALVPGGFKTSGAAKIEISSGGLLSNPVLLPAAVAAPGIYSINGSGLGQGYIRNSDGSFNSPNRPAKPGDAITIFATGVGDISLEGGYVVLPLPVSIFVEGFYANGVTSAFAPAGGLPGKAYQITVTIPTEEELARNNPANSGFRYQPQVAVTVVLGQILSQGGYSPAPEAVSSQPGIALYIRN